MLDSKPGPELAPPAEPARRRFLARFSLLAMLGGLGGGYGAFAALAGRYLYPSRPRPKGWMYVADLAGIKPGGSMPFRTPSGERVNIARLGARGDASDLIALSSTCPHLGCQVFWEAANNRFFCPCHNGAFDPTGKATEGPPAKAGQSLPRYPLKVEEGLVFIEVSLDRAV